METFFPSFFPFCSSRAVASAPLRSLRYVARGESSEGEEAGVHSKGNPGPGQATAAGGGKEDAHFS